VGYRHHARQACRPDLPIAQRVTSFRVCIARVCRLGQIPFMEACARYRREFDLSSPDGLLSAVASLEAERDFWLGRHELFAAWKWRRRYCSPPPEVAGPLYGPGGDGRHTPTPVGLAVYVLWLYRPGSSDIGCRFIKGPPGHRAILQDYAAWQPCRVSGPFFGREVIAYLCVANERSLQAVEEFLRSTAIEVEL